MSNARTSTNEQQAGLEAKGRDLKAAGVEKVFSGRRAPCGPHGSPPRAVARGDRQASRRRVGLSRIGRAESGDAPATAQFRVRKDTLRQLKLRLSELNEDGNVEPHDLCHDLNCVVGPHVPRSSAAMAEAYSN